jgi:hypothetical protein
MPLAKIDREANAKKFPTKRHKKTGIGTPESQDGTLSSMQ